MKGGLLACAYKGRGCYTMGLSEGRLEIGVLEIRNIRRGAYS